MSSNNKLFSLKVAQNYEITSILLGGYFLRQCLVSSEIRNIKKATVFTNWRPRVGGATNR